MDKGRKNSLQQRNTPNIIYIRADDLGYGDLVWGTQGAVIPPPPKRLQANSTISMMTSERPLISGNSELMKLKNSKSFYRSIVIICLPRFLPRGNNKKRPWL